MIENIDNTAQLGNASKALDETFLVRPEDPSEPDYKASYRRQMDMYQWIARKKGFQVSNTGYFVYVDGQHRSEQGMLDPANPRQAWMRFNVAVIPYEGNDSWVEDALRRARYLVSEVKTCPEHSASCEYGAYLKNVSEVMSSTHE